MHPLGVHHVDSSWTLLLKGRLQSIAYDPQCHVLQSMTLHATHSAPLLGKSHARKGRKESTYPLSGMLSSLTILLVLDFPCALQVWLGLDSKPKSPRVPISVGGTLTSGLHPVLLQDAFGETGLRRYKLVFPPYCNKTSHTTRLRVPRLSTYQQGTDGSLVVCDWRRADLLLSTSVGKYAPPAESNEVSKVVPTVSRSQCCKLSCKFKSEVNFEFCQGDTGDMIGD